MSQGIDPGRVRIGLTCADGRIGSVRVASERPQAAQALRGRRADEAVRLVPLLFSLCGKAQGRAAILALEAARGLEYTPRLDAEVRQEVMREHLWRWLLDLPQQLDLPPLRAEFVEATRWIAGGQRAVLAGLLGGAAVAAVCERLCNAEDVDDANVARLPTMAAAQSLTAWPGLDADFCRRPEWNGAAAETGAISRRESGSAATAGAFAARWLARLAELLDWADGGEGVGAGGTASAVHVAEGRGRALVETARGLLMHEILLDGDRIADYFIVAPTEWNFHPQGPLEGWLDGRPAMDREAVRRFATRAVTALDPCVGWELEWL